MLLPPIKIIVPQYQSNKKKRSSSLKTRNSEKHIEYPSKIIKARYYTEQRDKNIASKLMNFIGLEKIKSTKNYTQICQQNMRKFYQLKQELKNNHLKNSEPKYLSDKKIQLDLNPKGSSLKIHMKTEKSTIELRELQNRNKTQKLAHRVKSSLVTTNDNMQIRTRLKREAEYLEQRTMKIKKYSQMSIRQIIGSDPAETLQVKKRLYNDYSKRPYQTRADV